jgi:hypothetical protein
LAIQIDAFKKQGSIGTFSDRYSVYCIYQDKIVIGSGEAHAIFFGKTYEMIYLLSFLRGAFRAFYYFYQGVVSSVHLGKKLPVVVENVSPRIQTALKKVHTRKSSIISMGARSIINIRYIN